MRMLKGHISGPLKLTVMCFHVWSNLTPGPLEKSINLGESGLLTSECNEKGKQVFYLVTECVTQQTVTQLYTLK